MRSLPELLAKIIELANQLEHQPLNQVALDALRNLTIQAYLIDQPNLAHQIMDAGLFTNIFDLIRKATYELQRHKENPNIIVTKGVSRNLENYQLAVEQAFICLTGVAHFIDYGPRLQGLTQSELVSKSVSLAVNFREFGDVLSPKIFKQVSQFLLKLSKDNEFAKSIDLAPIEKLLAEVEPNEETADFYCNMMEFHFNVTFSKAGQVGVLGNLEFYASRIQRVLGAPDSDPVALFSAQFLANYKRADHAQNAKAEEEELKEETMQPTLSPEDEETKLTLNEEDKLASSDPNFRVWLNKLLAQTNCIRMLKDIADFLESDGGDGEEDEDFEDCDEMSDGAADDDTATASAQVIDLDEAKAKSVTLLLTFMPQILQRTQPLPHQVIGLARPTEDALDELQEISFSLLTSLLYCKAPGIRDQLDVAAIMEATISFMEKAVYKCERPSGESCADCLATLVSQVEPARVAVS